MKKVSILMLTYNAPAFVKHSIKTLKEFTDVNVDPSENGYSYELIVYDNCSEQKTKDVLKHLDRKGMIDSLVFSDQNYYFVAGNNKAFEYAAPESDYILLLNSDIEIRNSQWLSGMLKAHKRGITACQVCSETDYRPDGWCLLGDKDLYEQFRLDEERFTWFGSIADFASRVMKAGYSVQTIRNYGEFIRHFGGSSEIRSDIAKASQQDSAGIDSWFPHKCEVVESIDLSNGKAYKSSSFECINVFYKVKKRMKRMMSK